MWRPNRLQWVAIWLFTSLALLIWTLGGDDEGIAGRAALSLLIVGGLVVWSLSYRKPKAEVATPTAEGTTVPVAPAAPVCPYCAKPKAGARCSCGEVFVTDAERKKLRGTGGWLILLCLGLVAFQPLQILAAISVVIRVLSDGSTADVLRVLPTVLLLALRGVAGVVVGILLINESRHAVLSVRVYFIALMVAAVVGSAAVGMTQTAELAGQYLGQNLGTFVAAAIWLSYFRKSKRVFITYGRDAVVAPVSRLGVAVVSLVVVFAGMMPVVVLRAGYPDSSSSPWVQFEPAGGRFQVSMPGTPKESEKESGVLIVKQGVVETSDGVAFVTSFYDLPDSYDLSDQNIVLDTLAKDSLTDSTIVELSPTVVSQHPARSFHARDKDGFVFRGVLVLIDKRIVMALSAIPSPETAEKRATTDRFLRSLVIR